jgi:5-dehydro-2-deoxygluconokinase
MYSEQIGSRLEDVASFRKYLGGSAANIAVGASRMGLRTAMLTGVGPEAFGTFVRNALSSEGVDVSMVKRDDHRLTALVALAIREQDDFPRIFYYSNSADMALGPEDVDWSRVERVKSVLLTGTYLSKPRLREMALQLAGFANAHGIRVILDVDFRPVLWGLVPLSRGNAMTARSPEVTSALRSVLPLCDLVVGTEEELKVAGGAESIDEATASLRALTRADVVRKRGHLGCTIYRVVDSGETEELDVPGYPVEVVNSVGAGDAFMSGFLAGWLRGRSLKECAALGNACGALVVSRHGCTPAMPTSVEVDYFMAHAAQLQRASEDSELASRHRIGTRRQVAEQVFVLAFDHRWQLEVIASTKNAGQQLTRLKSLIYQAFLEVAEGRTDVGILIDDVYGKPILEAASGTGIWIGRALDIPRSHPLQLMGGTELLNYLRTWPTDHVAKVLAYAHPSDAESMWRAQIAELLRLNAASSDDGREYLVELQPSPGKSYGEADVASVMDRLYRDGVRPDWWKLPPATNRETWTRAGDVVRLHDASCRGILILGQTSTPTQLKAAFDACSGEPYCRGFAVGRSVFLDFSTAWLAGESTDDTLIQGVAERFLWFISTWQAARQQRLEAIGGVG